MHDVTSKQQLLETVSLVVSCVLERERERERERRRDRERQQLREILVSRRLEHTNRSSRMVAGVRFDVKTISFPTLRHFQVGSPNTDRRLFQSALATGASRLPSLLFPLFLSRCPKLYTIQLDFCPTKIRAPGLASTRENPDVEISIHSANFP